MVDFTVAIPTYNGESRISDVLERLRTQIGTEGFSWEIIVVDNNSIDNTEKIIREYQLTWPQAYPLRYLFAPEQGAAFARQKAVEKAKGSLIGFLDDDNLPDPDWVAAAYAFGKEHPEVGAYGSQIHGYFYEQNVCDRVPENVKRIACFLAIVERGKKPHWYDPQHKMLPPGAGLVVRKSAWTTSVPQRLFLNHKGKEAGLASEDLEALLHIQKAGWDIWYNPAMVVHHKIPNSRLEKEYLQLLVRCVGLSRHRLRMMTLKSWQKPLAFPAYLANDLRRLVLHIIKHGGATKTDTSAACEREFLTSTLLSPLFLLKHQVLNGTPSQNDRNAERDRQWLENLAEGFEEERFRLHSQLVHPLTDVKSDRDRAEILLRLEDKNGNLLLPGQFMPVAERYNLMRTIDRWAIRRLCTQIADLGAVQHLSVYEINLSAASIEDRHFITFLDRELKTYQVSPEMLCFGIRVQDAIADLDRITELIHRLKDLGCQFSLDGVSGRLSPREYLQKLPVDYLRIDGELVKSVLNNSKNMNRVDTINQFAQKLGMKTIAAFVENQDILEKTKILGINYAQGYGIDRPHPLAFSCRISENLKPSDWQRIEKLDSEQPQQTIVV